MRLRARLFFIFFLHDFPSVIFIGGDFAEFQTIPERVVEIKMGLGVGCGGCGFGALKVLDVKVVIVFVAAVVVTWIAAAHVATCVENLAGVLLFFFFFVVFG